MAHYRPRYVEKWTQKMCRFSPLIGLLGHRQVGKTSLAERLSSTYFTLDNKDTLAEVSAVPDEFLRMASSRGKPVIIDECQLAPTLFPALKEFVRRDKHPGQFILTGSVRFTSRKAIRESLTGRIVNIVIPPLGCAEICEVPTPSFLKNLLTRGFKHCLLSAPKMYTGKLSAAMKKASAGYETLGGLPGVCFIRDDRVRMAKFESQIETILERDLRLLVETTLPFSTLRRVLAELAAGVGEPLNLSEIQRRTRVSANTLRKLIHAFESMFLIELVPCHDRAGQPLVYFVDTGEARHLSGGRLSPDQSLSQRIYSDIKASLSSLWNVSIPPIRLTHFATRGGTSIPLVLSVGTKSYGFLPRTDSMTMESVLAQTKSFMRVDGGQGVIIIRTGMDGVIPHHAGLLEIPPELVIV